MLKEHIKKVKSGEIKLSEYIIEVLDKCNSINKEYSYFNTICEKEALKQAKEIAQKIKDKKAGKLAGLIITIKDNICVRDVESTAGSRILKGYKPLFDATAIERLRNEDAVIIGKTSCDAFGFGSFNTNVGLDFEIPKNPHDKERVTGGSSGGSAGITAVADFAHVAIAESTGGSIESPASFCGVIGFCPTYGRVSRSGLISYANSLDKIGIMTKNVKDIAPVLEIISGFDEKDSTSLKQKMNLKSDVKKLKIGIIKESLDKGIEPEVKEAILKTVEKLKKKGFVCEEVSLPITFKFGVPTYYLISTSEASTNLSCLSGLRYGQEEDPKGKSFSEYFSEIRTKHFNEESKRRIMLGTFSRMAGYRDAYYIKATKIRTKIIEEYKKVFEKYDVLISPTMPVVAPKISEVKKMTPLQNYMMDILTVGPNLTGMPHATIPVGNKSGLSIGLMATTDHLEEGKLLQFLEIIEGLQWNLVQTLW